MELLVVISVAFMAQAALNLLSDKIDYPYNKTYQGLGIVLSGVLWGLTYRRFGLTPTFVVLALTQSLLLASSFVDLKYKEIPNSYNLGLMLLGGAFIYLYRPHYQELMLGGIIAFALFFVIMVFTGAMGGGDVKMAGALGLFMGTGLLTKFVVYTFMGGALVGILLMVIGKRKKDEIFPFGPCIALSAIMIFIQYF